jgi:predicted nucleotidyltransferase
MPAPDIVRRVLVALNQVAIPHMLVGSFARNYYADPRSTKDADVVVAVTKTSLAAFVAALGPDFRLDSQPSFETNTGTMRDVLMHPESGFTVELFYLSEDPYDQERFQRRRSIKYDGVPTSILTAEDVVVTKLRWARSKDLDDVRDVIAMQGDEALNWPYIHRWTAIHGSQSKMDRVRASLGHSN